MKVLMFGWEFPPHISGGLGTACLGLTQALTDQQTRVLFVVPKAYGDETNAVELINASTIEIREEEEIMQEIKNKMQAPILFESISVNIELNPYQEESEQTSSTYFLQKWNYTTEGNLKKSSTKRKMSYSFSGTYGRNLMEEVERYAEVAAVMAKEKKFDIIHAHDWMTYRAGCAAKKVSGKPLVVQVHATEFDRAGENNINTKVYDLEREGMEKADHVVAVSQWTKNIIVKHYHIPAEKVTVVHNGVLSQLSPKEKNLPKISDKVVTFLGRMTHQKGPAYFIEAAALVLKKFKDAHFIMAGSGDLLPAMIEKVARLHLSDHFHFTGFLKGDQVDQIWSMSNVYVMPSVSEPFGITPLEALQAGVPIIISNQSGVAEVMPHAIKVDFWDVTALANAICGVLNYKTLAYALKKNGATEMENISWDAAAKKLNQLYHELTNHHEKETRTLFSNTPAAQAERVSLS